MSHLLQPDLQEIFVKNILKNNKEIRSEQQDTKMRRFLSY